jgi:hypothetical protein
MARLYDYRCRTCGATHECKSDRDPGPLYVCACKHLSRYWRSRPEVPFVQRDLTGIRFGPSDAEIAETGRPNTRIRDDVESMTLGFKEPVLDKRAKEQLRLL